VSKSFSSSLTEVIYEQSFLQRFEGKQGQRYQFFLGATAATYVTVNHRWDIFP